ncbi:SDR family NAD(P)-dependent oxidoreductase [Actinomadura sediminis]|uniref:SDR family NAD(P)-dependent oxidoreductase n=1 Tax=Actinomadura sediminis TaxID=1038904 RepID=A0ABW3ELV5_9ACTN
MVNTDSDDKGRPVAIVTGGGTGIGRAVARELAAQGHEVLIVGRTEETLEETKAGDDSIHPLVIDVTHEDGPSAVVSAALEGFGRLDVLVNNAGIAEPSALSDLDAGSIDRQLAVNLRAPMLLTGRAVEALAASRGVVVNLSSAGSLGRRGWPGFSAFGATKAGIDFLTRTWAVELAPMGIRVLAVAPGVIDRGPGGPMGADAEEYGRFLDAIAQRTPLRRVGRTAEIAWWVSRLVQPEAAFATGTVLVVDGGLSVT